MFSRKSSSERGAEDAAVPPARGDGVVNDGTTAGTATGATGAHARDVRTEPAREEPTRRVHEEHVETAHEKYGGLNTGAAFFGWLVAVAMAILLTSIIGAIATGASRQADVTQNDAERAANTIGLVAAIVLVAVLAVAYYTGGYVAGRMSRFDGARQGLGVWVIGLLVTIVAVAVGWIFGDQYNVLDRVDLPRIPIPTDEVSGGGIVTGLVVVVATALAAMLGGTVGRRYHTKVDRHLAR